MKGFVELSGKHYGKVKMNDPEKIQKRFIWKKMGCGGELILNGKYYKSIAKKGKIGIFEEL